MTLTAMLSNQSVLMVDRPRKAPAGNVVKRDVLPMSKICNACKPLNAPASIVSMPVRDKSNS